MRCPRCGKELKDTALFCSRCGSKINPTSRINPVVANRASITGKYRENEKSGSSGFGLNPVTIAAIALVAILLAGAAFAVMDTGDTGDDDDNDKVVIFSDKSIPIQNFGNTYQISNIYNLNAYYFAFLNVNLYDVDVLAFLGNPIAPTVANGDDSKDLKEVVTVPEVEDSEDDDSSSEDSDGISDLSELVDSSASSEDSSADDSSSKNSGSDDSSADDSSSNDDKSSKSDSSSEESSKPDINTITIKSVDVTGGENDEPAECEIHVGSEYAGCEVNVSALYSSGDQYVNDGEPVTKTVDSDGNITIKSSLNAGSEGMMMVDLVNVTISADGDEICFYEQPISIEIGSIEDASSDSSSSSDSSYDDSYYNSYDDSSYDDSFYDDEYYSDDEYYYY